MSTSLDDFAAEVGPSGPVAARGAGTAWAVGGELRADARIVAAPQGIVDVSPAEMTVRVRAGTLVSVLHQALDEVGQQTSLPERGGTVGGALAVGHSSLTRRGRGPVRDAVLEATVVSADGCLVRCGGPTVKNVSGFDLCRLHVGALGTLGLFAEVVLRTRPRPARQAWLSGAVDPAAVQGVVHGPSAVLWDGDTVWVLLEGHAADVDAEHLRLESLGLTPAPAPMPPGPHRWSLAAADVVHRERLPNGPFLAELGVGTVHSGSEPAPRTLAGPLVALNESVRDQFDPARRLNPGRVVVPATAGATL